jgi:hypothetical protein
VRVALRIGATSGALFGKYATLKVFASGGIDAPESEYLTVQPASKTHMVALNMAIIFFIY